MLLVTLREKKKCTISLTYYSDDNKRQHDKALLYCFNRDINKLESFHLLEAGRSSAKSVSHTHPMGESDGGGVGSENVGVGVGSGCSGAFRYEVVFDNIVSQGQDEYTVTISTELNGRTVTQTVEKFPMGTLEDAAEPVGANADPSGPEKAAAAKQDKEAEHHST